MAEWPVVKHMHALGGSDQQALLSPPGSTASSEMMATVGTFGADRDLTVVPTTRRTQEL